MTERLCARRVWVNILAQDVSAGFEMMIECMIEIKKQKIHSLNVLVEYRA